ncbi:serine/threonine/tyrosine-interacting-like protein 2 [Polypterus senegalus]|uniref:serine/threonine/tyrosine-interacting-like protein 2 n=1 Tax=Polypterus senegalus TaxID=55291 RepID=UPI0019632701|nr:serine/threonine/tyrosine-interacting-like protein 2 [Polypterus senegalus]XP_039600564.1 serine/threonine/tyrosine-interacting-like protein 2 [Polypterus senegalus]
MASSDTPDTPNSEQVVPEPEDHIDVRAVQNRYLRSPSPSRFSIMSDTDTESIFMEPIHLSSAVAAKQIINEELKPKEIKVAPMPEEMMESAEQLLVEDLYNRVKEMVDDTSRFNTPCVLDIQRLLTQDRLEAPMNPVDEVWPNIFIGEKSVAVNKPRLKRMGITHILNAAHGTGIYTGQDFYTGMEIQYLGIEVDDFPDVDISKHFRTAAEFLDEALLTYRGKILVSSVMGVSRSAVFVAAYLMIFHHMTIMDSLLKLRKKRPINPNEGFLRQLRDLNEQLLEERSTLDDDEHDTLSQSSVIEAKTHSVMAEEEDLGSVIGAKVHSIVVEEEDNMSTMSSVMRGSISSKKPTLIDEDEEEKLYEEWRKKQGLTPSQEKMVKNESKNQKLPEKDNEEDVDHIIQEWQRRNEKYQSEDWWKSNPLNDDELSLLEGSSFDPCDREDLESVNSSDIRELKEYLVARGVGRVRNDSVSTETSASDIWTQRLREIENQAAERYGRGRANKYSTEKEEKDIDEESLFSDTSSLYNFCKKNKDKLTPLERWKIKRIQFGWNKRDAESADGKKAENGEEQTESESTSQLGEVNLTAYQAWKLKHQKKLGNVNKDEIVELTKGEDTASVKRKQRRTEILERSRQNLEESQSMCGWETESSMSGSIPFSAFWPNMSLKSAQDDTASMLSMQSNRTSVSQARSIQNVPQTPLIPIPNLQAGNNEAISLASIQNWIANVVTETIVQKQNELLMQGSLPSSRASSVFGMNTKSAVASRNMDDDKVSLLSMQSGASCGSSLHQKETRTYDNQSLVSFDGISGLGFKEKITQTSKPLYSLFGDDIDLKKLDTRNKEMQSEIRGKASEYQKEKLVACNKRSTLFKKKKAKDDSDEDEDVGSVISGRCSFTKTDASSNKRGHFSSLDTEITDRISSVDKWLSDVKESSTSFKPERKSTASSYLSRNGEEQLDFTISKRKADSFKSSYSSIDESNKSTSKISSKAYLSESKLYPSQQVKSDELNHHIGESYLDSSSSQEDSVTANGMSELGSNRTKSRHVHKGAEIHDQDSNEYGARGSFNHHLSNVDNKQEDNNSDEDIIETIRARVRSMTKQEEDLDDDSVINSWRSHQGKHRRRQE